MAIMRKQIFVGIKDMVNYNDIDIILCVYSFMQKTPISSRVILFCTLAIHYHESWLMNPGHFRKSTTKPVWSYIALTPCVVIEKNWNTKEDMQR